jgi:protection-of-telomeres protein 1
MWNGGISLLANYASEFHLLSASKIPRTLPQHSSVPWQSTPPLKSRLPTPTETSYVIWANSRIGELLLPEQEEFQSKSMKAMNVKDKFSLLKDVKPERFYNILGEVIRVYDGSAGTATLYISDYTANTLFYNNVWGDGATEARDGDEFGYLKPKSRKPKDWPGPYGKMSIQLTLYDGHADFVREKVKVNQWVLLNNVQMNFGKMGGCLEGFLRGDRDAFEGKVQVQVMEQSEEPDENDARWKEAVARKYQWWKKFKQQKQAILDEAAGLGDKRKRDDEEPLMNSKQRRQERRAAAEAKVANAEAKVAKKFDLNENSK